MMDNTALQIPEPSIGRLLEYRPHLKWSCYASLSAALVCFASAFLGFGNLAFAGSLLFLAVAFFTRPFAFTRVFVSNESVNLDRFGEIIEIPFSKVVAIGFTYLPYVGGWFTLKREDGRVFRFTLALERSDYILDAVAAAQPLLVSAEKLEKYRRTAIVCDHSWARVYTAWKDWHILLALFCAWPVMMGTTWSLNGDLPFPIATGIFSAINFMVGLSIWWSLEVWFMNQKNADLLENPLNPLRDMKMEAKYRRLARISHFVIANLLFAASTLLV